MAGTIKISIKAEVQTTEGPMAVEYSTVRWDKIVPAAIRTRTATQAEQSVKLAAERIAQEIIAAAMAAIR